MLSEEACSTLQKTLGNKIREANSCTQDSECTLRSFGCPFGCESVVRADQQVELTRLTQEYGAGCNRCYYDCDVRPGPAKCLNNKCVKITGQMIEQEMPRLNPSECKTEQQRIRKENHKARACLETSDCVASPLRCPFGCHELVNKNEYTRIEALYSRFSKTCKACEYKCAAPSGEPYCLNKRCVWKE